MFCFKKNFTILLIPVHHYRTTALENWNDTDRRDELNTPPPIYDFEINVDITPAVHMTNGHHDDVTLEAITQASPRVADALSTIIREVLWGNNNTPMEDTTSASAPSDVPHNTGTEEGWISTDCVPDEIYYSDISSPASEVGPDTAAADAAADTAATDGLLVQQLVQEEKDKDSDKSLSERYEELKHQHAALQHVCRNMKDELNVLLDHYRDERMLRFDAESRFEISEFSLELKKAQINFYKSTIDLATVNYAEMVRRYHSVGNRIVSSREYAEVYDRITELISHAEREGY